MSDAELIAKLQLGRLLHRQAADRIEALVKEREELEGKLDELQDRLDTANKARAQAMSLAVKRQYRIEALTAKAILMDDLDTINMEKIEDLEVKLAKAVEALHPFAEVLKGNYSHQSDALPISMGHGKDDLRWVLPLGDFRLARVTIAEIKPENRIITGLKEAIEHAKGENQDGQ